MAGMESSSALRDGTAAVEHIGVVPSRPRLTVRSWRGY